MIKENLKVVETWLLARQLVCSTNLVAQFLTNPNEDKINGANELFNLFLYEVRTEMKSPI